jgi:hypothetical protein
LCLEDFIKNDGFTLSRHKEGHVPRSVNDGKGQADTPTIQMRDEDWRNPALTLFQDVSLGEERCGIRSNCS